jgi:hypothetical protein
MANIKKCDICGKIFEGRAMLFGHDVASSRVTVTDYGDYSEKYDPVYNSYDTCPHCTSQIQTVIKRMKLMALTGDVFYTSIEPENPCDCRRCRKRRKEARAK